MGEVGISWNKKAYVPAALESSDGTAHWDLKGLKVQEKSKIRPYELQEWLFGLFKFNYNHLLVELSILAVSSPKKVQA